MKNYMLFILIISLYSCVNAQEIPANVHQEPTHNFSVHRLIVMNDKGEILMEKDEGNWYTLSYVYNERQFVREALDSLAAAHGISIEAPQLRGYFSYKYEYHPFSTLRSFYVAKYKGGKPKAAGTTEEVKWIPADQAINLIPVESIQVATRQILDYPKTLWGGSFIAYRTGKEHHARQVEDFYPLFE